MSVKMMYRVYKVYNVCLHFITFSIMSAFVVKMMYKVSKYYACMESVVYYPSRPWLKLGLGLGLRLGIN